MNWANYFLALEQGIPYEGILPCANVMAMPMLIVHGHGHDYVQSVSRSHGIFPAATSAELQQQAVF